MLSPRINSYVPPESPNKFPKVSIHNLHLMNVTYSGAIELIRKHITDFIPHQFVFVNAHVVTEILQDHRYRKLLTTTINWNDEVGIALAARLHRQRFLQTLMVPTSFPMYLKRLLSSIVLSLSMLDMKPR